MTNELGNHGDKQFLSLLSLAQKAGKLVSGETGVEIGLRRKEIILIIIAGDVSDNTKKKFTHGALYHQIPIAQGFTKDELGKQIGKNYRSVIGIIDEGFLKGMMAAFKKTNRVKLLEVDLCQE